MRNENPFPILAMNCPGIEYTYRSLQEKGIIVEELHTLGNGEAKYFNVGGNEGNLLEGAWSIWNLVDDMKSQI